MLNIINGKVKGVTVLGRQGRDPPWQMQFPGYVWPALTFEELRDDDHVVDDGVGGHVLILHQFDNEGQCCSPPPVILADNKADNKNSNYKILKVVNRKLAFWTPLSYRRAPSDRGARHGRRRPRRKTPLPSSRALDSG